MDSRPTASGALARLFARIGMGPTDLAQPADRELARQRLALFTLFEGGLLIGLWTLQIVILVAIDRAHLAHGLRVGVVPLGVGLALVAVSAFLRRAPLSERALRAWDAGIVIVLGTIFGLVPLLADPAWRPELLGVLLITFLLFLRAAIVPSDGQRTALLGLVAGAPLVIGTWLVHAQPGRPPSFPTPALFTAGAAVWVFAATKASSLVSYVIYGLARQVEAAMQLGQYTLEEKIGEGGMGVVYRARHALLRRPTAIKLLRADHRGAESVARFEREVQMTSRLTHPNTVAIYDYGQTPDGIFYYAMEHLDGFDLESVVRRDGPLPPGRVLHLWKQIADALGEAHSLGLIHRDIKPGNLLLCERGGHPDFVKVLDFGLVREIQGGGAVQVSKNDVIQGTPLYMSPEQILAPDAIDARSDLYSLAAVAYFLLTGSTVFEGRNVVEICGHHLHSVPVAPSTRAGIAVPASLERVLLRCLAKSPGDRPRDAAELRALLAACDDVPAWSEDRAQEWWRERAPALRAHRAHASPSSRKLDVDLVSRAAA